MKQILFLILTVVTAGCSTLPTVSSLRDFNEKEVRLDTIARNILLSNTESCEQRKKDYGFKAMWLLRSGSPEETELLETAYGISDKPTITVVIPDAPFHRSGIKAGDSIVSVNDRRWSVSDVDNASLSEEIARAQKNSSMKLIVNKRQSDREEQYIVYADDICDANVVLVNDPGTLAYANKEAAFIESGLLNLLENNNELAFVVAHEIAHVVKGHTEPEKVKDIKDKNTRSAIEKEADELAVQFMVQAGYDPEGAYEAVRKLDHANRGPITRFLGLYGEYMPTEKRVKFLEARINGIRLD